MRYRQFCALARAAELLGERWTLLVVRELLLGPRRFSDLRAGIEDVSPSVLSARLAGMERSGLIRRSVLPPPAASAIYELTPTGEDLRPAVHELIRWGGRFLFPPRPGEQFDPRWTRLALQACARRSRSPRRSFTVQVRKGRREAVVGVTGGPGGTTVTEGPLDREDARVTAPFEALLGLIGRSITPDRAVQDGLVEVTGDRGAFVQFPELFDGGRGRPVLEMQEAKEE